MALAPGRYGFVCRDCKGTGEYEIAADEPEHPDHGFIECDDCGGSGEVVMDEDDAQDRTDVTGDQPLWVRLAN